MEGTNVNFEKEIIKLGERQQLQELQDLVKNIPTKTLITILTNKIGRSDAACFWNYLLRGFVDNDDSKEKRFICVKAFLKQLKSIELSYKQTYDLLTRLFLDLPSFTCDQLIEIVEFASDWLKVGDPKSTGWKDLLPEAVNILSAQQSLDVNSVRQTGTEYRTSIVKNLCTMKWPINIYTPIANMFRDMKLTNDEISTVLTKFCCNLHKLSPTEIPSLSFQLFSLCTSASQIIIPILSLERYFHKHYYKKLYADMESDSTDYDSIDPHSDKELREAEETVLHHLSYCTQFKISEQQFSTVLKNLSSLPSTILTPFILSATLSMTKINRDPETPLIQSILLPLLRLIIKNNEDEKLQCKQSAWFRDALQTKDVDLDQIFTILIDQNKDGKDVITPGLVNLSFILLKTKNSTKLNTLAISFLQKFIKKRFIFGQGIVKNLAEWMIVDQEATQFSECLTILSLTDTFTLSECVKTVKYVLDFFLWIPGTNAMKMMSFILPIVKISHTIRDAFIDVLKKAIYSRDNQTCRMGVHGFCMLLKQLRNNNSQRSSMTGGAGILTQQSISGYSLMSQITLGNKNNPQRHFDMLALEIIGVLRVVFTKSLIMKQTMYEDLTRAIEINPKITPHILQFIERHFRSYFNVSNNADDADNDDIVDNDSENECEIKFEKIVRVREQNDNEIEILEDLGRLTMLVANCIILCDKYEQLEYDSLILKNLFKLLIENMTKHKNIESFKFEPLTHEKNQIALQILGFIEALMYYAIWTSTQKNDMCENILILFKLHRAIREKIKNLSGTTNKKQVKKNKNANDTTGGGGDGQTQYNNVTINGTIIKKLIYKPENIWELPTLERFQRLLHDEVVSFASTEISNKLRSNRDLVCYVLEVTATHFEALRSQPDYKQITHSKRVLQNLIDLTKLLYERCIKRLTQLWSSFDVRAAYLCIECLKQSLITADVVFKRKFTQYINQVDFQVTRSESKAITIILQETIEAAIRDEEELIENLDGKKIPLTLIQCLEILYDNLTFDDELTMDAYKWLFKFCQSHELNNKDLGLIHKLLFNQHHKTHFGIFYCSIAMHLEKIFGKIDEEVKIEPQFEFKSITETTVETCTTYLLGIIRRQIEEIEYLISKCKSTCYKLKITIENDQEQCIEILKSMERSISSKLLHICETLLHLTNCCLPLGTNMDNLIRVLMQYYICLTNLTKHFIIRQTTVPVSFQGVKFDQLIKVSGKPLAKRIYSLITYIEASIFDSNSKKLGNKKKSDPQADKAKVLRDTKLIPKIILRIENFNKFIMLLTKKSKNQSLTHYLHMGTVRDFRIKTSELKEAIDKTLTHSNQIECDESMIEEIEQLSDDDNGEENFPSVSPNLDNQTINKEDNIENLPEKQEKENIDKVTQKKKKNNEKNSRKRNKSLVISTLSSSSSSKENEINLSEPSVQGSNEDNNDNGGDIIRSAENKRNSESQILENLEKINRKSRKRKTIEKKKQETEEVQLQPPTKNKRSRKSKN